MPPAEPGKLCTTVNKSLQTHSKTIVRLSRNNLLFEKTNESSRKIAKRAIGLQKLFSQRPSR